jgi:hypothetical protein
MQRIRSSPAIGKPRVESITPPDVADNSRGAMLAKGSALKTVPGCRS